MKECLNEVKTNKQNGEGLLVMSMVAACGTHAFRPQFGEDSTLPRYEAPSSSSLLKDRSTMSRVLFFFSTSARWKAPLQLTPLLQKHTTNPCLRGKMAGKWLLQSQEIRWVTVWLLENLPSLFWLWICVIVRTTAGPGSAGRSSFSGLRPVSPFLYRPVPSSPDGAPAGCCSPPAC